MRDVRLVCRVSAAGVIGSDRDGSSLHAAAERVTAPSDEIEIEQRAAAGEVMLPLARLRGFVDPWAVRVQAAQACWRVSCTTWRLLSHPFYKADDDRAAPPCAPSI